MTDEGASGRIAIVSLCSTPRVAHLRNQLAASSPRQGTELIPAERTAVERTVVWIGDDEPPTLDAERVLRVPPGSCGLRLAAARNAGAAAAFAAGAGLVVFLDADCVPGRHLLDRYRAASLTHPDAVLSGPVTYLAPGFEVADPEQLAAATSPHPARPDPPAGSVRIASADEYRLFWSLSFAMGQDAWRRAGGFDEGYEGYGGEDTDFAFRMRERGVPFAWVGGAHAYHQHHPTSSPPWEHLDDILRNGARFAHRWGEWPMTGWLEAFAAAGAVSQDGRSWRRTADQSATLPV